MRSVEEEGPTPLRQLALGALVLGVTALLANVASFHASPGAAIADRLAVPLVARLSAVGYFAQLAAGVWLSLALILDVAAGRRWAPVVWLAAVCLYCAPLPSLTADPALIPALLAVGGAIGALGHTLLRDS